VIISHTTTIHATCPFGCWDYYRVEYLPTEFITAEDFQLACDAVRGKEMYQEKLAELLASYLLDGELIVTGMHGANTNTVVTLECGKGPLVA